MPAFVVPLLVCTLCAPPPLRDEEPLPWPRAAELSRRSVELLPQAKISLPTCEAPRGARNAGACAPTGPALGAEFSALYRPSSYFAFGPSAAYAVARGHGASDVTRRLLSLGVSARVYLLEAGAFDPYLESLFGFGSLTTTVTSAPGRSTAESAFGPLGRAGGGVGWFLSPSVKVGMTAGFTALFLPRRPLYPELSAGLELGFLLGDRL